MSYIQDTKPSALQLKGRKIMIQSSNRWHCTINLLLLITYKLVAKNVLHCILSCALMYYFTVLRMTNVMFKHLCTQVGVTTIDMMQLLLESQACFYLGWELFKDCHTHSKDTLVTDWQQLAKELQDFLKVELRRCMLIRK